MKRAIQAYSNATCTLYFSLQSYNGGKNTFTAIALEILALEAGEL